MHKDTSLSANFITDMEDDLSELSVGRYAMIITTGDSNYITYFYNYKGVILYNTVYRKTFNETKTEWINRSKELMLNRHYSQIKIPFYNKEKNKYKLVSFT